MKISKASTLSLVPSKTIRYYEEIGIIGPINRTDNGYRDYGREDIEALCLIRRMRHVGFTINECRQLLTQRRHEDIAATDFNTAATDWQVRLAARLLELREISQVVSDEIMPPQTSDDEDEPKVFKSEAQQRSRS